MKIKCENIGKLESAEVEVNTVTVIAGLNSTGKSTIGKLFYCIFNSLYNLENAAKDKLKNILRRYIGDKDFFFEPSFEKVGYCVKELFDLRNRADIDSVRVIIESYMGTEFVNNRNDTFFIDLVDLLNISNDVIYRSLLQNKLSEEFEGQIQNFYLNKNSSINLKIGKKEINVLLQNNEVSVLENFINLRTEAIYLDDPFVLDTLNKRPMLISGHKKSLFNKLRTPLNTKTETEIESVIKEIVRIKKIDTIYKKLDSVCNGNIVLDPKEGFKFQIENSKEKLNIINISTGLKAFVIMQSLLINGSLEKQGTLILDEPEIHLHPEWQKLLAEIIILIQKEFDMHILINSHSPYFINAIDVYAKKYKIRNTCKFYLAKDTDETHRTSTIEDVSDNIEEINKLLFIPLQDLENERSEINEEND